MFWPPFSYDEAEEALQKKRERKAELRPIIRKEYEEWKRLGPDYFAIPLEDEMDGEIAGELWEEFQREDAD